MNETKEVIAELVSLTIATIILIVVNVGSVDVVKSIAEIAMSCICDVESIQSN